MEYTSRANQAIAVSETGTDERSAFIIKTYVHLLGAIIAFTAIEVAFFKSGFALKLTELIMGSTYGYLLAMGAFMLVGGMGSSMARRATSMASQYLGLAIYVLANAIFTAPLLYIATYTSGVEIIGSAAWITLLGFGGLTAVALKSRRDFSGLGPYLMWASFCALGLILASFLMGFQLGVLFFSAMIALAGAYILKQTSSMMRTYPTTHYVSASLELFASVALMFWYVLRLLMSLRD
jgi:FtsH-binding integral membrane protein